MLGDGQDKPKSGHRLASWRIRWRSSAHVGVLAHRLASSAAEKRAGFRVQQVVQNPEPLRLLLAYFSLPWLRRS